jgi:hypothetical protein
LDLAGAAKKKAGAWDYALICSLKKQARALLILFFKVNTIIKLEFHVFEERLRADRDYASSQKPFLKIIESRYFSSPFQIELNSHLIGLPRSFLLLHAKDLLSSITYPHWRATTGVTGLLCRNNQPALMP